MRTSPINRLPLPRLFVVAGLLTLLPALGLVPTAGAQAVANQLRSYADVAEKTMPAVVNISTDKLVDNNFQHPFSDDPMFRRFFNMPDDDNHRNSERMERSLGSGIVISSDGYILTNNHVVENASKIKVTFQGEREYEAEIVGADPPTDVALIKIDAVGLPTVDITSSDKVRIGDQVMAIGNPFGVGQTVTLGIVSALGRNLGLAAYSDYIQTDAAINRGNSGGALVNMRGQLIGMNSAILSTSGGSQGIGFAIPTDMAMKVVTALRDHGEVARAYLGVLPQAVDQSLADYYGLERPRGVLIAEVNDDTPAEEAGLRNGDIILTVDGEEIKNPSELRNTISLSDVGHPAELVVLRDGKEKAFTVKLGTLPDVAQNTGPTNRGSGEDDDILAGVTVRELNRRARAMADLPDDIEGILVTEVAAASNAAGEGLARGDVIQEVNRTKVTSLDEFKAALDRSPDRPIFMRVYKPGRNGGPGQNLFLAIPR